MLESVDKEISNAFEKLNIIDEQPYKEKCSESSEFSFFKPQILAAVDHIKEISHKRPDLDAIFDFIKRSTASNIDKEAIKAFIAQLLEQKMKWTQHLKRTQKYNMKKIYVGNLNKDLKINDLNELFGPRYLQESCSIELPMNEKKRKM